MKLSKMMGVLSDYARAEIYAVSSIRRSRDLHLLWGPAYARLSCGIGARNFSLYGLAGVPRKNWPDYLANEPLKKKYAAFTPREARVVADNKLRFFEHCRLHGLATPPVLALITAQPETGGVVPHAYSPAALAKLLPTGEYFIKPGNGSHGEGAFSLRVTGSQLHWSGKVGSHADFFDACRAALRRTDALVVQPKLVNHEDIVRFTRARGLSTIRVVTVRSAGGIDIIGACMRIIVGDSEVDAFRHGTAGNLVAAIDVASGMLATGRGSSSTAWPKMRDAAHHPISRIGIPGYKLPYWEEVIALTKKAHGSLDGLQTVGWDVAITDNGAMLVEANWRYDIDILQVAYQTGYRRIIDAKLAA